MTVLNEHYALSNGVDLRGSASGCGSSTTTKPPRRSARPSRWATATSTPPRLTATSPRFKRASAPVVSHVSGCSSIKLAAAIKDREQAAAAIAESLEKLGLDCVDLTLIHAPQPWNDLRGGDYAE